MIALYARVSTQEQAEHGYSITEQTERLKSYCDALQWTDYTVYTDAGFSGSNTARPGLQSLISDIHAGKIKRVLVYKLDRLSRSQRDTLALIEDEFLSNGVGFISLSENFDTSTPFGRASIGILAVFAQLEREQIKERLKIGLEARAKAGKYCGAGLPPLGYVYKNGELIINKAQADYVRLIFDLYTSGHGLTEILHILEKNNYPHKLNYVALKKVLRSRLYVGDIKFNKKWYKGNHKAIIKEEQWNHAQALLKERSEQITKGNAEHGQPMSYLGGLMRCARCGNKYYLKTDKHGKYVYYYYVCALHVHKLETAHLKCDNKNWKMETLDQMIFDQIRQLKFHMPEDRQEEPKPDTSKIKRQIKQNEKQLAKLIDLYAMDNIPRELLQKKIDDLTARQEDLARQLNAQPQRKRIPKDEIIHFDDILKNGTLSEVRKVIKAIIAEILLDGDNITIKWNF